MLRTSGISYVELIQKKYKFFPLHMILLLKKSSQK